MIRRGLPSTCRQAICSFTNSLTFATELFATGVDMLRFVWLQAPTDECMPKEMLLTQCGSVRRETVWGSKLFDAVSYCRWPSVAVIVHFPHPYTHKSPFNLDSLVGPS